MKALTKIGRAARMPKKVLLEKVLETGSNLLFGAGQRRRDLSKKTYSDLAPEFNSIPFSYFEAPAVEDLERFSAEIRQAAEYIIEHKFNLLGSGWTRVFHGLQANGIEDHKYENEIEFLDFPSWLKKSISAPNLEESLRIAAQIDSDYIPLDWQLDFKSGFRWSESSWYKDIVYGNVPGADIKVPWELGRMQHLPVLCYAGILADAGFEGYRHLEEYKAEFCNQILDFIAANPPRFGVQWMTAMDAALRLVSWLVSYDMFKKAGAEFAPKFEQIFLKSIYEHVLFIEKELEWSSGMRGNHYLAGLAGLLFAGAYLPDSPETNCRLAFAIQELFNEALYQFLPDGGNFEASLHYHFLSAEILFHCISLILVLPEEKANALQNIESKRWKGIKKLYDYSRQNYTINKGLVKFDNKLWERLEKIAEFTCDAINPDGSLPLIGDNDSGRFLKLMPNYYFVDSSEIFLSYLNLRNEEFSENASYLFDNLSNYENIPCLWAGFIEREIISRHKYFPHNKQNSIIKAFDCAFLKENTFSNAKKKFLKLATGQSSEPLTASGTNHIAYPDFGLYLYENYYYKCLVRCGQIGQNGKGGHAHNDQLSFYMNIKGFDFFVDPGTYLYTSLPEKRNLFRSTEMHNTLLVHGYEQNRWHEDSKDDLFWLEDNAHAKVIQHEDNFFIGEIYPFPEPHRRKLTFNMDSVECEDLCELDGKLILFHLAPFIVIEDFKPTEGITIGKGAILLELKTDSGYFKLGKYFYSREYGVLQEANLIILRAHEDVINWKIEILAV